MANIRGDWSGTRLGEWFGDPSSFTWTNYLQQGNGPPNGRVTSPNGDVVVFDSNGTPDYTIPHAGSGMDADVNKDPASPFYGWTQLQVDQYAAARGATGIMTDAVRAASTPATPGTAAKFNPAVVAASDAALRAGSALDPRVSGALTNGIAFPGDAEAAARAKAARDEQIRAEANAALQSMIRAGALFTDTIAPGMHYVDAVMRGMISTQQWVDDYISVANGGQPTNANAAKGKFPAGYNPATGSVSGGGGGASSSQSFANANGGGSGLAPGQVIDLSAAGASSFPLDGGSSGGSSGGLSPLMLGGLGLAAVLLLGHRGR